MKKSTLVSFRNDWERTKSKVNGLSAIKHKVSGELTVVGKYGEIFPDGDIFWAVIKSPTVANRICKGLGRVADYKKGDEARILVTKAEFGFVVKEIKTYLGQKRQIDMANAFGLNPPKTASLIAQNRQKLDCTGLGSHSNEQTEISSKSFDLDGVL